MMNKHGFTFIEMLIGISIFAVVALTLFTVFWTGVKVSHRSEDSNRVYREARWAFDRIADDLESAVPYQFRNSYPDRLAFSGTSDSVTFIVPQEDGLTAVEYTLKEIDLGAVHKTVLGNRHANVKSIEADYNEDAVKAAAFVRKGVSFAEHLQSVSFSEVKGSILTVLLKLEEGVSFSYARKTDEQLVWKEEWKEESLPFLVRIKFTFLDPQNEGKYMVLRKDIFIPAGGTTKKESEVL